MSAFERDNRLEGRVAIVIGAGSRAEGVGNGRAASILMARSGAKIALIDAVPAWAEVTQRMIADEGGEAMVLQSDVTKPAECEAAVAETAARWGRVDILVNNVGIGVLPVDAGATAGAGRLPMQKRSTTPP